MLDFCDPEASTTLTGETTKIRVYNKSLVILRQSLDVTAAYVYPVREILHTLIFTHNHAIIDYSI